jgi:tRNA 2-thiouridine synthesizing protein A
MNTEIVVDCRGLSCPMPIVNAKKALTELEAGQTMKVLATDPGSVSDFQGWVKMLKNAELMAQETTEMEGKTVYVHLIRKLED